MTRGMLFGFALLIGCSGGDRPRERRAVHGDTALRAAARPESGDGSARADSALRRDSTAARDTTLAQDPPCFASHFGLPCQ